MQGSEGKEARACANCKNQFTIELEDFAFYEKIKVPPPTWCPECRLVRRMMFQNERALHRRQCDLCKKDVIAIFPKEAGRPVYCEPCWWSDKWDAMDYGKEIDWSRPLLEQFSELIHAVPDFSLTTMHSTLVNSDYCNIVSYLKNCYLVFNSDYGEDCAYSACIEHTKNSMDLYMAHYCELSYMSANIHKCSRAFFSNDCDECIDVWFSKNLTSCLHCFGCVNLRNKQYYIFNQKYTKEEYFAKLKDMDLGSFKSLRAIQEKADNEHLRYPRKSFEGLHTVNSSGDRLYNTKNVVESYDVGGAQDVKYSQFLFINGTKDSYDFTMWGGNAQGMYECMGSANNQKNMRFVYETSSNAFNIEYSWHILSNSSNLFGCVGIRNKQYCILNKQYSREEYGTLVPKIIEHMKAMPYKDAQGKIYAYGEFFPPEMSAFPYNESIAQKYFPLTKDAALEKGLRWQDNEARNYKIDLKADDVPDTIAEVSGEILNTTIGCAHEGSCSDQCTMAFRVIKEELAFYRNFNLPLPRLCPNCRHYSLLNKQNPIRFYDGACACRGTAPTSQGYANTASHFHADDTCPNKFRTSYPPGALEIVYCEQCYNAEVV